MSAFGGGGGQNTQGIKNNTNAPDPRAMCPPQGGFYCEFSKTGADREEYELRSIACHPKYFGASESNFCTEMQRWDDYKAAKGISDGVSVSLRTTFDTLEEGSIKPNGARFISHRYREEKSSREKIDFTFMSFPCFPHLFGAPEQNFSTEMLRWDQMREMKKINDNSPCLQDCFFAVPPPPAVPREAIPFPTSNASGYVNGKFVGFLVHSRTSTGETHFVVKSIVCKGANEGQAIQNLSTEMIRWDDYRQAKSINDGTPSMQQTFETAVGGQGGGGNGFGQNRGY